PMILGPDKARLSKRHGATSVMAYQEMGYLPEALVNYLVRLGWSHGDQEIFSLTELIELFNLEAVGKAPAVFNPEKLLWLNQHYIKECPPERLAELVIPFWKEMGLDVTDRGLAAQVVTDLRERAKTLKEMAAGSAFYFVNDVAFDEAAVIKFLAGDHIATAEASGAMFAALAEENYTKEGIENALRDFAAQTGKKLKDVAQPLRVALTGTTVSPPLDSVMTTLGKQKVIERIRKAVAYAKRGGQA
ncbi:MAG: glutamate--tRNA ligase family protein, partial [Dehalococcoidia bacterium]|nr:glutamate--tRNA ligase family protein [Dehalococcoidia bacterium]